MAVEVDEVAVRCCLSMQPEDRACVGQRCGPWRPQLAWSLFPRMPAATWCGCPPSTDLPSAPLSVLSGTNCSVGIMGAAVIYLNIRV